MSATVHDTVRNHVPVYSETSLDPEDESVSEVTRDGRDYLVFPIVALKEMVLEYPEHGTSEFLPRENIAETAHLWSGTPLVFIHPENDEGTAANPESFVSETIGQVFEPDIVDETKLRVQAWLDVAKANDIGGLAADVVERLQNGEELSVSAGYGTLEDEFSGGRHNGTAYDLEQGIVLPDHVAIFPSDDFRARCDWEDGCGAPRANYVETDSTQYTNQRDPVEPNDFGSDTPGAASSSGLDAMLPGQYSYEKHYGDVYPSEQSAENRAERLGCSGVHVHRSGSGRSVYMPCESHDEYERVMRAQAESNLNTLPCDDVGADSDSDPRLSACEVQVVYGLDRANAERVRNVINAYHDGGYYRPFLSDLVQDADVGDAAFERFVVDVESALDGTDRLNALHATMDVLSEYDDELGVDAVTSSGAAASGVEVVSNQQEGWPDVAHQGLCEEINNGEMEGFFTACMDRNFSGEESLPSEEFCAWLHNFCFDKWPNENALRENGVSLHRTDDFVVVSAADHGPYVLDLRGNAKAPNLAETDTMTDSSQSTVDPQELSLRGDIAPVLADRWNVTQGEAEAYVNALDPESSDREALSTLNAREYDGLDASDIETIMSRAEAGEITVNAESLSDTVKEMLGIGEATRVVNLDPTVLNRLAGDEAGDSDDGDARADSDVDSDTESETRENASSEASTAEESSEEQSDDSDGVDSESGSVTDTASDTDDAVDADQVTGDSMADRENEMTLSVEELAEHTMFSTEALNDMDEDMLERLEAEVVREVLGGGSEAENRPEEGDNGSEDEEEQTSDEEENENRENTEDTVTNDNNENFVTQEELDERLNQFENAVTSSLSRTLEEKLSEHTESYKENAIKTEENVRTVANALDISEEAAQSLPTEDFEKQLRQNAVPSNYGAVPGEVTRNYEDTESTEYEDYPAGGLSEWQARNGGE